MVANKILTFMTNIMYNNILTDMETGYKVFRRPVVENMTIHARRFDFEPEFTAKILKAKVRIFRGANHVQPARVQRGKEDPYVGCLRGGVDVDKIPLCGLTTGSYFCDTIAESGA